MRYSWERIEEALKAAGLDYLGRDGIRKSLELIANRKRSSYCWEAISRALKMEDHGPIVASVVASNLQ